MKRLLAFSSHNSDGTVNTNLEAQLRAAGFFDGDIDPNCETETEEETAARIAELENLRHPAHQWVLDPLPNQRGQRHGLFAKRSFHLLQGSSGTAKTTFGINMLRAQEKGEEFIGRATIGMKYLVVWQDRSEEELYRQLENLQIPMEGFPYMIPSIEQQNMAPAAALAQIMQERINAHHDAIEEGMHIRTTVNPKHVFDVPDVPEVLMVEGIDLWAQGEVKDMRIVRTLATEVRNFAKEFDVSVIGTLGAPKQKPKERYTAPRDRAFGSSAWARLADTVVDIVVDEESEERQIQVLSRTGPPQRITFVFNKEGLLVEKKPAIAIGPAEPEPVEVPSIKEIMRSKRCGLTKAKQIHATMHDHRRA